ncbi:hypothetical protein [Thermocrinis sp.]
MKLRKLFRRDELLDERSEVLELFKEWQEISYELKTQEFDNCLVLEVSVSPKSFDTLIGIFSTREEALGAFLSLAEELGWEKVPESFAFYHAIFDGNKVIAGIKVDGQIYTYDQLSLEDMIRQLASKDRIVVYSLEVITYIKDIYPEVDRKTYSISKAIAQKMMNPPDLSILAKLYGKELKSIEDYLNFIEDLTKAPIRLPEGEVELPPLDAPTQAC